MKICQTWLRMQFSFLFTHFEKLKHIQILSQIWFWFWIKYEIWFSVSVYQTALIPTYSYLPRVPNFLSFYIALFKQEVNFNYAKLLK